MKTFLASITLPVLLAACSGTSSMPSPTAVSIPVSSAALAPEAPGSTPASGTQLLHAGPFPRIDGPFYQNGDCESDAPALKSQGGKTGFPVLESSEFYGHLGYARFNVAELTVVFTACIGSVNKYDVPVPAGFTPDWFLNTQVAANGVIFSPATVYRDLYATTWLPKTDYYLYVYDGGGSLIESYKIGPLKKKKGALKFASPFQNFAVPQDRTVNFEIVHPTP
jgi:hypothetical protein